LPCHRPRLDDRQDTPRTIPTRDVLARHLRTASRATCRACPVTYGVPVRGEPTGEADRPAVVYGPERWRTAADTEWSHWDLWFCVVCLVDHDGDWDALDTAIYSADRYHGEAKWSHLLDLTERLRHAGLTAADLVGATARDRKVRTRARTKVMKSSLYPRDLTPPMSNPPSTRLCRRALFGSWPDFPRSPQAWYDSLSAQFDLDDQRCWDGWATRDMAYQIAEAEQDLAEKAGDDPAQVLAARRAALTLYYEAAEACDDSYGGLGDVAGEAIAAYARADWRASGITPDVFWLDLLQWCVMAGNFGLLHRSEVGLFRSAGVTKDLDLADAILADLASDYTTTRMHWHAEQALQLRACAVVAAGRLKRFESTAAAIGSRSWLALDTMVDSAVKRHRIDIAIGLLDAADVPGQHRERVRRRRAELAAAGA